MSIGKLISEATSELARAQERVKKAEAGLERRIDKQVGRITKVAEKAVGHVEHATRLVTSATATLNRVLPLLEGDVVQRGIGLLTAAAGKLVGSRIAAVQAAGGKLEGAVTGLQQKFAALGGVGAPTAAVAVVSSLALRPKAGVAGVTPQAAAAMPHLLLLKADDGATYHFGLSTAAFDSLRRQTTFGIDTVPRLGRPDAAQAVSMGSETLALAGTVYVAADKPKRTGGTTAAESDREQLNALRAIGRALKPVQLITGYGEVLGRWYMTSLSEEQGSLRLGGLPRKQTFNLEFKRYGDDYKNV